MDVLFSEYFLVEMSFHHSLFRPSRMATELNDDRGHSFKERRGKREREREREKEREREREQERERESKRERERERERERGRWNKNKV